MAESATRQEKKRVMRGQVLIYGSLIIIALLAVTLFIIIWQRGVRYNTLPYQLATTCVQVLGITLVGAVVSFAGFTFQHNRERQELESDRKQEDWRREVERIRDARQRRDELLRTIYSETVSAFHSIKRTRRILRAQIWAQADGRQIDAAVYDQQMASLIDAELQIEELMRTAPLIDDDRVNKIQLEDDFSKIERYLSRLVTEYETKRRNVAHVEGDAPFSDMAGLAEFLRPAGRSTFNQNITGPINDVLSDLQKALLQPIALPVPTTAD